MKLPKNTAKLLHDMASELEMGFQGYGSGEYCIEIPASDARKLLRRYEKWSKQLAVKKGAA